MTKRAERIAKRTAPNSYAEFQLHQELKLTLLRWAGMAIFVGIVIIFGLLTLYLGGR